MTNGEKIKAMFPSMEVGFITESQIGIYFVKNQHNANVFDSVWWNAEYKEPTTPNDCETCIHNKGVLECDMYGCKYEPNTKNDLGKAEQETDYTWEDISSVMDAMEYRTNSLIENIKSEIMHFANAHCSGDDINIYDVIKVIDDCFETENSTTKNDLGVDCISRQDVLLEIIRFSTEEGASVECQQLYCDVNNMPSVTPQLSSELEKNSQKLEKNFGELDCISRADAIRVASGYCHPSNVAKELAKLPSVTPQEPQSFECCDTCKEYDQEKHCCHRWTKVIRNTVEEMKQEYIEREVLDKIREEIERQEKWLMVAGYNQYNVDIALDTMKSVVDKYKAESENP